MEGPRGDGQDPLEIPEILDRVISNISSFQDMTNIRKVSNFWREASLEKWRSSATLQITLALINKFFEEQKQVFLNRGLFKVNEAQYIRLRLTENPFQRYRIPFYHMAFPPGSDRIKERFFWNKMGQHMKFLDMEQCLFDEASSIEGLEWILLKKCPNLEELKMKPYKCPKAIIDDFEAIHSTAEDLWEGFCPESDGEDEEDDETTPRATATLAEKLKTLTISTIFPTSGTCFHELFQGTNEQRSDEMCQRFLRLIPNLQNLYLAVEKSPVPLIAALKDLHQRQITSGQQVQLENLKIETIAPCSQFFLFALRDYTRAVIPPIKNLTVRSNISSLLTTMPLPIPPHLLSDILRPISQTLERLDLTFDGFREDQGHDNTFGNLQLVNRPRVSERYDLSTLQFPRLTHLRIRTNYTEGMECNLTSFEFSSFVNANMPELKDFRFENTGPKEFKNKVCEMILSKEIFPRHGFNPLYPFEEEYVLPTMENLEKFHYCGRFDKKALKILGTSMINLKVLETILSDHSLPDAFEAFSHVEEINLLPWSRVSGESLKIQQEAYPNIKISRLSN